MLASLIIDLKMFSAIHISKGSSNRDIIKYSNKVNHNSKKDESNVSIFCNKLAVITG